MNAITESSIRTICLSVALVVCLTLNYASGWKTDSDLWTLTMMIATSIGIDFGLSRMTRK